MFQFSRNIVAHDNDLINQSVTRSLGTLPRAVVAVAVGVLALVSHASAEEFTVADGDVASLIDAINAANNNDEPDTIHLGEDGLYTLTSEDNNSFGLNGFPKIESVITIDGHGATIARSSETGTPEFRFFFLPSSSGGDLTLSNLTLDGGSSTHGGTIRNWGNILTIIDCTISNSTAANNGGVIHSDSGGVVTITGSTFTGNTAGRGGAINKHGSGGGITIADSTFADNTSNTTGGAIHYSSSTITITGSTFSNNTAQLNGGGLLLDGGTMNLTNCTISGNTTSSTGGGIWANGTTNITHCTVTGNSTNGGKGGGIYNLANMSLNLSNTIVANSIGGADMGGAPYDDLGYNLIQDGSGITSSTSISGCAMLDPLADNGGPTMTHALLAGSPAIDAGDCHGGEIDIDQRSVARPQGDACDIGSLESKEAIPGTTGDINNDSIVDGSDLGLLLGAFGSDAPSADLNCDGTVNGADLGLLLGNFGG